MNLSFVVDDMQPQPPMMGQPPISPQHMQQMDQQDPQLMAPEPVSPHHIQQMMVPPSVSPHLQMDQQNQQMMVPPSVSPHLQMQQMQQMDQMQDQIIPSVSPHLQIEAQGQQMMIPAPISPQHMQQMEQPPMMGQPPISPQHMQQMDQQDPQLMAPAPVSPHHIQQMMVPPSVSPHLQMDQQNQQMMVPPSVSPHLQMQQMQQMDQMQDQIIPSVSPHLQIEAQGQQMMIPAPISPQHMQMMDQQAQQIIPSVSPHLQMEAQAQQIIPSVSPHLQIDQQGQQIIPSVSPHLQIEPQEQQQIRPEEQLQADQQGMQEYTSEEMQQAQAEQELLDLQSMQLDGLKKVSFQKFVPSNPDNYIITNHSLLKRKTALASGNNMRRVNSALVLAEAPTPNDIARELMPNAKIARLVAESSDSTKSLLEAFESGNFSLAFAQDRSRSTPAETAPSADEWGDEFEEEREAARDEEKAAQPCEIPQTREQQTVEHILRENSFFLYNLQAAQYQRLSGVISKAENSCATKLARNITDLGIVIPTTAVVTQNEVDKALRESDLVNDLVPTEDSDESSNETKSEVETKA